MLAGWGSVVAGGAALGVLGARGWQRLALSRAKHHSLAGHARWSRRLARLVPFYEQAGDAFFAADDAPVEIVRARQEGFSRLSALYAARFPKTSALTAETRAGLSDLQFTGSYRVPFQFSRRVREALPSGSFLASAEGVTVTDLDGNTLYDLTGSYGVNLLGVDAYRRMIAEGARTVEALGPVLGGLHPVVADNVRRLRAVSGLDEVSFHMSGTEAVMQAVNLARYHTGRSHIVRFCGAYHGWWGDVQPGVGNPVPADRTYTLADMSERALKVIARRKNIACVLVNPLQALHPNSPAPGDSTLVAGGRRGGVDRAEYSAWLKRLAETCRKADVVLIVDEVFTGFRLAHRGACEYFGVQPDMVTFGKTLGGGLPNGVLCGRAELMRRFKPERPADICFARGTFNSHPYVMGAMDAFLRFHESAEGRALYDGLDERWRARCDRFNAALAETGAPVRASALGTIWTILHDAPSRYNWMLQYYLRAEGLALSWVGTGRLIFNLAFDDAAFEEVVTRFAAAARRMAADGWWWVPEGATNKSVSRAVLGETLRRRFRG